MNIREWIVDNIAYRFGGCGYAKYHDRIYDPIKKLIPLDFMDREIFDLGCGDGQNTLRIKKVFEAKSMVGYERNSYMVEKAIGRGIKVKIRLK